MRHPSAKQKLPRLKVWLAGGAILLAVLAAVTRPSEEPPPIPVQADFEASLQEQQPIIVNESQLLSQVACPENEHTAFEALKRQGMAERARGEHERSISKFQAAFGLCAAPEVLIALNNALIGDESAYTLAVSVPFNGENANNAVEMLRGFAQAQDQVNQQGGIDGVPLKLLLIDDGDSEETARSVAIALADNPDYADVLGIVGHWSSDVSLRAAAVYRDRQTIAFITPISTTKELTGYSPWVFRSTINNRNGAQALARYMLGNWRLKKAAIFYVGGVTYSEEIRQEFRDVVEPTPDGEIVAEFDMSVEKFRAERSVQQAIEAGAEVILLATNNGAVDEAISVISANNSRLKVLGDLANLYTPRTLTEAGDAAVGMVMAVAWDIDGAANPAFVKTSRDLWRGPVNYVTAMSYDAVGAMAVAIEESAMTAEPTRARVQKALNDPDFTVRGATLVPSRFVRGDRQARVQLVEVVRVKPQSDQLTKLDFVPILSVAGND
ncbi:MAG: ABC transporter substrate-binding protein [Phormidesmis sp.]